MQGWNKILQWFHLEKFAIIVFRYKLDTLDLNIKSLCGGEIDHFNLLLSFNKLKKTICDWKKENEMKNIVHKKTYYINLLIFIEYVIFFTLDHDSFCIWLVVCFLRITSLLFCFREWNPFFLFPPSLQIYNLNNIYWWRGWNPQFFVHTPWISFTSKPLPYMYATYSSLIE